MEPQELEKWERIRDKGMFRYILKYGSMLALGYAYLSWSSINGRKITVFDVVGIAITSIISGIAITIIFWYRKEIPYQKTRQNKNRY